MLLHVVKEGAIGCQNVFRGLAKMSCAFLSLGEQILASVARCMRYLKTADSADYLITLC
jgi:hypothetical protein